MALAPSTRDQVKIVGRFQVRRRHCWNKWSIWEMVPPYGQDANVIAHNLGEEWRKERAIYRAIHLHKDTEIRDRQ